MMDLEEALKIYLHSNSEREKNIHFRTAQGNLHGARQEEALALNAKSSEEWRDHKFMAISCYMWAFENAVRSQSCTCTGLCPGGAACADVQITDQCPVCGGPASVCKPRHLKGLSCG